MVSDNMLEAICEECVRALGVPVCWIGVPGEEGERVLAAAGTKRRSIALQSSFAALLPAQDDFVVVADLPADGRFASNPLVSGPPHVRFFAGARLRDSEGGASACLTVLGLEPRQLTEREREYLQFLAAMAAHELEGEGRIREADERFRDFFEQASDVILSLDPQGRVLHANDVAASTLGLTRGGRLTDAVAPEKRAELGTAMERVFSTGVAERVEVPFRAQGGGLVTLEGWLRPRSIEGRTALVRVVFRDVTDRKQFEAELGNARDAALESARLKTQFLTNVSHEIRTPMNGIVGMIDLLLSSSLDAEQSDYAHQARASAEQLLTMVDNILFISNLEAGGLTQARADFDLRRMLQRIIDVERVAALGKEIEIHFEIDRRVPAIVRGNQSKLRQVVTNLLDNAVKFTEKGSVRLAVRMQSETDRNYVLRFEVADTGKGIAEEDRLMLFERFLQLDAGTTRQFSGVGLGLATARHLVETMGGLIGVDSRPGEGSTFWFSIPCPRAVHGDRPIATSEFDLRGVRALLLDRQPSSRKIAEHYLTSTWEMRVSTAGTRAEALELLRSEARRDPCRVVLFDTLTAGDALEFARSVRADEAAGSTRLLVLLDQKELANEEAFREAGVNAWAHKPVGQRELLDALTIALAPEALAAQARHAAAPQPAPAREPARAPGELAILLAEDNFLNMKLTVTQLQKLGCTADVAMNGREVLSAVGGKRYDVILMDCQMPVLDGYSAAIELRRLEGEGKHPRHWIIAMTANALDGDREKCIAAGMDDYLAKPTHQDDLARALARVPGS